MLWVRPAARRFQGRQGMSATGPSVPFQTTASRRQPRRPPCGWGRPGKKKGTSRSPRVQSSSEVSRSTDSMIRSAVLISPATSLRNRRSDSSSSWISSRRVSEIFICQDAMECRRPPGDPHILQHGDHQNQHGRGEHQHVSWAQWRSAGRSSSGIVWIRLTTGFSTPSSSSAAQRGRFMPPPSPVPPAAAGTTPPAA